MKILALNPRKKRAGSAKKKPQKKVSRKGKKMAIKKTTKKKTTKWRRRKTTKKRRTRRNPSSRGVLSGTAIPSAAKSMLPMISGALIAKLAQKRFGDKTPETGNWTWKDYAVGGLGALAASLASKHLLRASASTQQKILEGGFLIIAFKLVTQEIVPMSTTATEWLGEDGETYVAGDLYQAETGETFVLGENGEWGPVGQDEMLIGDEIEQPGRLGDEISPPGRLGDDIERPGPMGDVWDDAMGQRSGQGAVW